MEKKVMSAQTKGLIIGIILILISVVMYIMIPDMEQQQKLWWVTVIIQVALIIWACYKYADDMNGNVTFGNVFGHGFKTSAVMVILVVLYFVLAVLVLFPEMKDKAAEIAMRQMQQRGGMSQSQMDQAVSMQQKYFLPFGIGAQVIAGLLLGAIASLIGAAIAKKNPNPVPFQQ